jgi:small-conductance mechanosensitive channel
MIVEFFNTFFKPIMMTIMVLFTWVLARFLAKSFIRAFARKGSIAEQRTLVVIKYTNMLLAVVFISSIVVVWGVKAEHLWVVFSSMFTIIGVALFAQWSILSNITSGVIVFFSSPFQIGNYIKIHDKDFPIVAEIEDIKGFHIYLRTKKGEVIIYPNNMILQKGITVLESFEDEKDLE